MKESLVDSFSVSVIPGRARGRTLGIPTLNVLLSDIPHRFTHGIYAGWASIEGEKIPAAIHFGPRPVFGDTETFEIHLIDKVLHATPETVVIFEMTKIRDVKNFPSVDEMLVAIRDDIQRARAILGIV